MSTHMSTDPVQVTSTPNCERAMAIQCVGTNGHSNYNSNGKSYPMAEAEYEEVAQSSELFWEKLEAFHRSFGTKFIPPTVGGKALDLHHLFVEVSSRGGLEKVIRDRRWKEVTVIFNFPMTIASVSFVLRKYYLSLLYHFEQLYYFNKKFPPISNSDVLVEGTVKNQFSEAPELQLGCSVTGSIDAKFDNGYLVSVNLGSEELKGVLYHFPRALRMSDNPTTSQVPSHQNRKRSQMAVRDPSRPKPNRSGYTFFFAEQYPRLKPLYYGQEKAISTEIGYLWSQLTEAEKQVYQEKGGGTRRDTRWRCWSTGLI